MFELDARLNNDTLTLGSFGVSRLLLMKDKRYPWCILVPQMVGITEAYQLSEAQQLALAKESSLLGQTLMELYQGDSLNVAALGNVVSQLHVHHVVRFHDDATWPSPVWGVGSAEAYQESALNEIAQTIVQRLAGQLSFVAA